MEIFINKFSLTNENINIVNKPKRINTRCFAKKKYEFVFNLSEATSEVEAKEKNSPATKKDTMKNNIVLSIFFHHE
tara:strand:- start:8150 stop:8377 length:228 start_codon:yes stop_codon:yes gene_type:complete